MPCFTVGVVALFFGSEVAVSLALFDEFVGSRPVLRSVSRLEYDLFVVIQTQPLETFDDRTRRLVGGALQVSIFNPQQELAAHFASEKPVEES